MTTESTSQLEEITVSARRVAESVLTVPVSISVLNSASLDRLNVQSFQDYGLKIPNLSFQYGATGNGYANNRQISIRGISGNDTTGFYIDDTQVPISLDPQVVDIARIEVLKGPQGTLYGAGSMGGNIRIVTNQPEFTNDFSTTVSAGYTEHAATPDGRATAVGNLSLIDGIVALRVVGVVDHEGGFLTRTWSDRIPGPYPTPVSPLGCCGSANNQGATATYGGSATLLVKPAPGLSITARFMGQGEDDHGRRAQYAPVPEFEPLNGYTVPREADFQETAQTTWTLPSLVVSYDVGSLLNITSSTSYFHQQVKDNEDGTEGDLDYVWALTGVILPPSCCGHHWTAPANEYSFNEELRFSINPIGPFRAIFGTRYARDTNTRGFGTGSVIPGLAAAGLYPTDLAWNSWTVTTQIDESIFGETYWRVGKFELTLGARKFVLKNSTNQAGTGFTDGWENSGSYASGFQKSTPLYESQNGISPKAALSYEVAQDSLIYVSAAKGFRPGGANAPLPGSCDQGLQELGLSLSGAASYKSDNLWNYEIGAKTQLGKLLLTAAAFQMKWTDIQQSVLIPICYLGRTLNVGEARVRGGEFQLAGTVWPGLQANLGVGYQDPVLLTGGVSLPAGSRILDVPSITGSIALTYTRPLSAGLEGFVSSDFSYTGNSTSETSGFPLQRGGYGLLNARFGVHWDRYELELYSKNLTSREPNMGDIYLESVNQLDSNANVVPFVAIPPPRQVGLQFSRSF